MNECGDSGTKADQADGCRKVAVIIVTALPWLLLGLFIGAVSLVVYVINREPSLGGKAVNEASNLVNAIRQYEMDYSTYPSKQTGADLNLETDAAFMRILLGKDEVLNPRGNVYYEGKAAKKGEDGIDYSAGDDPVLVDPWGRPYRIVIDGDYDGKVIAPDGSTVELGVIVYSLGDDWVFDGKDPKSW